MSGARPSLVHRKLLTCSSSQSLVHSTNAAHFSHAERQMLGAGSKKVRPRLLPAVMPAR